MKRGYLNWVLALLLAGCGRGDPVPPSFLPEAEGLSADWSNSAEVKAPAGAMLGAQDEYETWSWRGVPFAQPPVGPLRWKAPRRLATWQGMRDVRGYGDKCSQWSMRPVLGRSPGA